MKYSEEVLKRFLSSSPFIGEMDENDPRVGCGKVGSPACGDIMKLFLLIEENIVRDVKIKIFGCASAFASSIYLAEICIGKSIEELKLITNQQIASILKLPKIKLHCSTLAEEALEMALSNYFEKNSIYFEMNKTGKFHAHKSADSSHDKKSKNISITPEAIYAITQCDQNPVYLNIIVDRGTCGIRFRYSISTSVNKELKYEDVQGLKIGYRPEDVQYVRGLKISYEINGVDKQIKFSNSLATGYCPCKSSISF